MNLKRKVVFVPVLCALFLLLPLLTFAQIGVSRLGVDIQVPPGEKSDVYFFEIIYPEDNPQGELVRVIISLADWEDSIDGVPTLYPPETLSRSLAPWIDFSPSSFLLTPGQRQKVTFRVNLPPEEKGPHWAMFVVRSDRRVVSDIEVGEDKKVRFVASVSYAVKVRQINPATARSEGKIVWAGIMSSKDSETFLKVVADFENMGTTFLKVGGRIEFRDERGETVDTIQIRDFRMLPSTRRRIESTYKKELPPGEYIALIILDFGEDYLVGAQVNFNIN